MRLDFVETPTPVICLSGKLATSCSSAADAIRVIRKTARANSVRTKRIRRSRWNWMTNASRIKQLGPTARCFVPERRLFSAPEA